MDNSLHWLDNNIVLKLSAARHVQTVAGLPQHCAALETSANASQLGSISNLAFGPNGELYLIEKPNSNATRVLHVDQRGRAEPVGCASPKNCSVSSAVSAVAVAPDGVVYIADKQQLQILALDYVEPRQDSLSGEYLIDWPQSRERYVFNRFGQHVTTKDLTSDNIKITFSYTKNGPDGKLMAIIDSKGNKVDFVRDAQEQVAAIETSSNVKSHLTISRSGELTHINVSSSSFTLFDYDPVSRLLVGRSESDGLTSVYDYDTNGRLVRAVLPDGERVLLSSLADTVPLTPLASLGTYQLLKNGSSMVRWGRNGADHYRFQKDSDDSWSESLRTASARVDSQWNRVRFTARSEEKSVKINGQKLLLVETDQSGTRTLYDGDRQLVLALACDPQRHLKELRLPPGFFGIRFNYDG